MFDAINPQPHTIFDRVDAAGVRRHQFVRCVRYIDHGGYLIVGHLLVGGLFTRGADAAGQANLHQISAGAQLFARCPAEAFHPIGFQAAHRVMPMSTRGDQRLSRREEARPGQHPLANGIAHINVSVVRLAHGANAGRPAVDRFQRPPVDQHDAVAFVKGINPPFGKGQPQRQMDMHIKQPRQHRLPRQINHPICRIRLRRIHGSSRATPSQARPVNHHRGPLHRRRPRPIHQPSISQKCSHCLLSFVIWSRSRVVVWSTITESPNLCISQSPLISAAATHPPTNSRR